MATLLLSCRSSLGEPVTLFSHAIVTDQRLVDTTSTYQTTQGATEILTPIVATPTPPPQGIPHLPVHFMQEATISLPLILKYSTKQPLRTNSILCFPLTDRPLKYLKFKMVMTPNVCNSQFSRSRLSISPFSFPLRQLL